MATPTRLDVLSDKMDKATPTPDGVAIAIPVNIPTTVPRPAISFVGQNHSSCASNAINIHPVTKPTAIHINKDAISFIIPCHTNDLFSIMAPNVIANIGPIIGDTNILATITTVLFEANPTAANIAATITNIK